MRKFLWLLWVIFLLLFSGIYLYVFLFVIGKSIELLPGIAEPLF